MRGRTLTVDDASAAAGIGQVSIGCRGLCPTQRTTCTALVGLLTSEFSLSSLLVVVPAFGPACLTRQWPGDWTNLQALGYSGGGRPGIAPGSLYIGPPTGAADHQRNQRHDFMPATEPCQRAQKELPFPARSRAGASSAAPSSGGPFVRELRAACQNQPASGGFRGIGKLTVACGWAELPVGCLLPADAGK